MYRATVAVLRAMVLSWHHGLLRSLGGSRVAGGAIATVCALAIVAWGAAVVRSRSMLDVIAFEAMDRTVELISLTFLLTLTTSVLAVVMLTALVADEGGYSTVVRIAPISRVGRRLAFGVPVLIVALAVTAMTAGPFVHLTASVVQGTGQNSQLYVAAGVMSVCGVLLGSAAVQFVTSTLRWAAIPQPVGCSVAIFVVTAMVAQQALVRSSDLIGGTFVRRLLGAVAERVELADPIVYLLAVAAVVGSALVWTGAALCPDRRESAQTWRVAGPLARRHRTRARASTVLATVQLLRNPSIVSLLTMVGLVVIGFSVSDAARSIALWPLGGAAVVFGGCVIALNSYAVTWKFHWLYRVTGVDTTRWITPLWLSVGVLSVGLAIGVGLVFLAQPGWSMAEMITLGPPLIVSLGSAMLAGLLVPADEGQPLSGIGSFIVASAGGIVLCAAVDAAASSRLVPALVLAVAVVGVLFVAYRRTASWRERDLVFASGD